MLARGTFHARSSSSQPCAPSPSRRLGISEGGLLAAGSPALSRYLAEAIDLQGQDAHQVALQLHEGRRTLDMDLIDNNLQLLRELCGPRAKQAIVQSPALLASDLSTWLDFMQGLGVPEEIMGKVCSESPDLLVDCSIYTAGTAILFFKSMGFSNEDIVRRVINYYPFLLSKELDRDIAPVVEYLHQSGCFGDNLRLLVWEYPRIFSRDYRRQVRKFQYLSVYGLSLASRLN